MFENQKEIFFSRKGQHTYEKKIKIQENDVKIKKQNLEDIKNLMKFSSLTTSKTIWEKVKDEYDINI